MRSGRVVKNKDRVKDFFSSCEDGAYLWNIQRVNPNLTVRDLQKAYFDKIDACSDCTGYQKYEIHEMFKKHAKIESTKDLQLGEWKELHELLGWWAFSSFDCIL